jgi:hypothetical protein
MTDIHALADAARPTSDDDWGIEPQIDAQNAFFDHISTILTPAQFSDLDRYCLKATADEMIDEALRLVALHA